MKHPEKIRIVVVDDHPMFREGVTRTFAEEPTIEVIAEGASAQDAVQLALEHKPDMILLDISIPGGGVEAAMAVNRICPDVRIVMLTVSENERNVMRSMQAGAQGYILKGVGGKQLISIVREVSRGQSYVSPNLAARMLTALQNNSTEGELLPSDPINELTGREEQILEQLSRGLSNKEIGNELHIAEKTVKHYVTNVLQKLRVRNRVEAALIAQRRTLNENSKAGGMLH